MKKFIKSFSIVFVLTVIVITFTGCSIGNKANADGKKKANSTNVGGILIAVSSTTVTDSVASDKEGLTVYKPTGKFFVVSLEVENNKKESITIDATQFQLIVGANSYPTTILPITNSETHYFNHDMLAKTTKKSGEIAFDVPKDFVETADTYIAFNYGSKTEKIKLSS
jgi:hypothetical protein